MVRCGIALGRARLVFECAASLPQGYFYELDSHRHWANGVLLSPLRPLVFTGLSPSLSIGLFQCMAMVAMMAMVMRNRVDLSVYV